MTGRWRARKSTNYFLHSQRKARTPSAATARLSTVAPRPESRRSLHLRSRESGADRRRTALLRSNPLAAGSSRSATGRSARRRLDLLHAGFRAGHRSHRAGHPRSLREVVGRRHRFHRQAGRCRAGRIRAEPDRRHPPRPLSRFAGEANLIKPGQVYKFKIDLWSTSNVFQKGHMLRLEISSSNFPRFDRNLNTGRRQRQRFARNFSLGDQHHLSRRRASLGADAAGGADTLGRSCGAAVRRCCSPVLPCGGAVVRCRGGLAAPHARRANSPSARSVWQDLLPQRAVALMRAYPSRRCEIAQHAHQPHDRRQPHHHHRPRAAGTAVPRDDKK